MSYVGLFGLKSNISRAVFLLEALGENPFPCLVQLLEAATFRGLWPLLHLQSQRWAVVPSHNASLHLCLSASPFYFKDLCDNIATHLKNPGYPP